MVVAHPVDEQGNDVMPSSVMVMAVTPGGAAAQSQQIQEGDTLLSIDGVATKGLDMDDITTCILGFQGSTVVLEFERNNEPFYVSLNRKVISQQLGSKGITLCAPSSVCVCVMCGVPTVCVSNVLHLVCVICASRVSHVMTQCATQAHLECVMS
jgi:hypothetical protein